MPATQLRLAVEYRNGDWNYLGHRGGIFVPCDGEYDFEAMKAAYESLVQCEKNRANHIIQEFQETGGA